MANILNGRKVAVLATDGFEQSELIKPLEGLRAAGAEVHVVSPKAGKIQGYQRLEKGAAVAVDKTLAEAKTIEYDLLILPGGVDNPAALRRDAAAMAFVRGFVEAGKPISAVCHGPLTLIDAGAVSGRKMTSWPSLKADLTEAGALWVDQEVVVDGLLFTSRKPDDLPAFVAKTVEILVGPGAAAGPA